MPTIVFCSSKGGAGKTTSAFLLAVQLAKTYAVTLIDADPNRPIMRWATGGNTPSSLTIVSDADEDNILERIEDASFKTPFVIVDLEGTAAKIVVLAVSQADFVIIPTQGSELDATEAGRGIRVVKQQEKISGRPMPYAVLMTRTATAIRSRNTSHIHDNLKNAEIPVFATELHEREAFKSVFAFRQTLDGLNPDQVPNLDKAKANIEQLAWEILGKLKNDGAGAAEEKAAGAA